MNPGVVMDREAWRAAIHGVAKSPLSLSQYFIWGFPGGTSGKETCLPMQETWV